jgi:hypothetical protein
MIRIYAPNAGKAKWLSFIGWMRYAARRKSSGIQKLQTENSIKNQTVQNMDLVEYCINLSKPAKDLDMNEKFVIKNLPSAGINSMNNVGKQTAFPL